ncbi:membrane protein insertase YidC [bacterium]|nr:membrane protein insertase YidC [bacterium]
MDKNTIFAFVLIGVILLLSTSRWYREKIVGVKPVPADTTVADIDIGDSTQAFKAEPREDKPIQPTPVVQLDEVVATDRGSDKVVTMKNDCILVRLSSRGGGTLISWKLIAKDVDDTTEYQYKTRIDENEPIEMIPDDAHDNLAITTDHGYDFGRMQFEVTLNSKKDSIQTVRFTRDLETGARLEKIYILTPGVYHLILQTKFVGFQWEQIGEKYRLEWNSGLRYTEPNPKDDLMYYEAIALQGDDLVKQKKRGSTGFQEGNTHWVSVRTKYFIMAIIPEETGIGTELRVEEDNHRKTIQADLAMPWKGLQEETHSYQIFLGPMDYQLLKSYKTDLAKSMSWGWKLIKPFSIGALYALQFLYSILHNYGWAIIVFAILIKIVLYPLTRHSYKSMREMQSLQPKMSAIREKYKDNPQKMNEETMKLYKSHGVNPMGGCLPMLLQMPVLFALFNLFRSTIMLRHAEFLMIKDLSAPDHLLGSINVLPVIMGLAMIVQQKLSSAQNTQQKAMTYFMPIFLTFIFYKFSSGLNLYYLIFNIFTIAQEIIVRRGKTETASV